MVFLLCFGFLKVDTIDKDKDKSLKTLCEIVGFIAAIVTIFGGIYGFLSNDDNKIVNIGDNNDFGDDHNFEIIINNIKYFIDSSEEKDATVDPTITPSEDSKVIENITSFHPPELSKNVSTFHPPELSKNVSTFHPPELSKNVSTFHPPELSSNNN